MREILFRAKTAKNVHWIWGDLFRAGTEPSDGEFAISYYDDEDGWMNENVQPATIGQFTGLTDKNGKRIFEGDIVECVSWNEYFSKDGKPMEPFRRKMFVDYRNGGFKMVEPMPEPMRDNEWDIICNGDIEIIGNIHDDPQLIDMKRLG